MTNTTEMPEKIWAEPVESGKVRGQWTESLWTDRDVPYTRTDTIPSRAAVVREFMGETNWRYKDDESLKRGTGNQMS